MRDWLSHLVLTELFERRQRDTISIEGCTVVRDAVKSGDLAGAVGYLIEESPRPGGEASVWFEREIRTVLPAWEADGKLSAAEAEAVRAHLDAGEWTALVDALDSVAEARKTGKTGRMGRTRKTGQTGDDP